MRSTKSHTLILDIASRLLSGTANIRNTDQNRRDLAREAVAMAKALVDEANRITGGDNA